MSLANAGERRGVLVVLAVCVYLPVFTFVFKNKHYVAMKKKKYFIAYYSSETEKGRAAFVVVCMERCSKQGHFPV